MFPYLFIGFLLWLLGKGAKKPNAKKNESERQDEASESLKNPPSPSLLAGEQDHLNSLNGTVGRQDKRKHIEAKAHQWTVLFTGLIFVVTSIYAMVSFFQWRTMEKSLRISERAYIVVSDIRADFEAGKLNVIFENIGRAPASEFKIDLRIERDSDDSGDHEPLEWRSYYFTAWEDLIYPGPLKQTAAVPLQNFTPADAGLIKTGQERLYVSCYIEYQDGFGELKQASFLFRYIPPPNEGWATIHLYNQGDMKERNKRESEQENTNKTVAP